MCHFAVLNSVMSATTSIFNHQCSSGGRHEVQVGQELAVQLLQLLLHLIYFFAVVLLAILDFFVVLRIQLDSTRTDELLLDSYSCSCSTNSCSYLFFFVVSVYFSSRVSLRRGSRSSFVRLLRAIPINLFSFALYRSSC